jgi:hypothetical protein
MNIVKFINFSLALVLGTSSVVVSSVQGSAIDVSYFTHVKEDNRDVVRDIISGRRNLLDELGVPIQVLQIGSERQSYANFSRSFRSTGGLSQSDFDQSISRWSQLSSGAPRSEYRGEAYYDIYESYCNRNGYEVVFDFLTPKREAYESFLLALASLERCSDTAKFATAKAWQRTIQHLLKSSFFVKVGVPEITQDYKKFFEFSSHLSELCGIYQDVEVPSELASLYTQATKRRATVVKSKPSYVLPL